jgi:hypothetical protein
VQCHAKGLIYRDIKPGECWAAAAAALTCLAAAAAALTSQPALMLVPVLQLGCSFLARAYVCFYLDGGC